MTIHCDKVINIDLDLMELFEHITGVRNFLRHSVVIRYLGLWLYHDGHSNDNVINYSGVGLLLRNRQIHGEFTVIYRLQKTGLWPSLSNPIFRKVISVTSVTSVLIQVFLHLFTTYI